MSHLANNTGQNLNDPTCKENNFWQLLNNMSRCTHPEINWIIFWAVAWDFQQFDVLTSVDSDETLQPSFKLRNSKWCSVSSLALIENSSDLQRLWSDCAYTQAGLSLCWSHIPNCWKSHALAHYSTLFASEKNNTGSNLWRNPLGLSIYKIIKTTSEYDCIMICIFKVCSLTYRYPINKINIMIKVEQWKNARQNTCRDR